MLEALLELLESLSELITFESVMVFAVVVAPISAVQIQKRLETYREHKFRQYGIFRTLMANRANRLSTAHVEAFNSIPIDFSEKKKREKPITNARKILLDHYCTYININREHYKNDSEYNSLVQAFNLKATDFSNDLLFEMSKYLGYDFDKIDIKNGYYDPEGHATEVNIDRAIRNGLMNVLQGTTPLDINVKNLIEQPPNKKKKKPPK